MKWIMDKLAERRILQAKYRAAVIGYDLFTGRRLITWIIAAIAVIALVSVMICVFAAIDHNYMWRYGREWSAPVFVTTIFGLSSFIALFYYGHLLFYRVQCSLVELCAVVAAIGTLEALLVTTPSIMDSGLYVALTVSVPAWVLCATVNTINDANVLELKNPLARLLLAVLEFGVAPIFGYALFIGFLMFENSSTPGSVTAAMQRWAMPVVIFLVLVIFISIKVHLALSKRVKAIFDEPEPTPETQTTSTTNTMPAEPTANSQGN